MTGYSFSGSALVVVWTTSGGTDTLTGAHQSCDINESIDMIDTTAGADADKTYINGTKDGNASFEAIMQSGTQTGGTSTYARCTVGQLGTLKVQPEGTASTKPYYQFAGRINSRAFSYPYSDVVKVSLGWQKTGALTEGAN